MKPEVSSAEILAGFSVNIERMLRIPRIPAPLDIGQSKILAEEITALLSSEGGPRFRVVTQTNSATSSLEITGQLLCELLAGSSGNIQRTVTQLQSDSKNALRVGIVATVGGGEKADSLVEALNHESSVYALMKADGTNVTLNLQDREKKQVLVCRKEQYKPPIPGLVRFFRKAKPRAVLFTAIRDIELEIVENVFSLYEKRRVLRVFGPHISLLRQAEGRSKARRVAKSADILALSEEEALAFVEGSDLFEGGFDRDSEEEMRRLALAVAAYGTRITLVTFAERGVIVVADGSIYRQLSYPPPGGVKDKAGAGDSFLGAFVYYLLARPGNARGTPRAVTVKSITYAAKRAAVVSAHAVAHYGASNGIPTAREVERYLAKRKGG